MESNGGNKEINKCTTSEITTELDLNDSGREENCADDMSGLPRRIVQRATELLNNQYRIYKPQRFFNASDADITGTFDALVEELHTVGRIAKERGCSIEEAAHHHEENRQRERERLFCSICNQFRTSTTEHEECYRDDAASSEISEESSSSL